MAANNNKKFDRISVDDWDQLISQIYASALAPELWNQTLINIAQLVGGHGGHLVMIAKDDPTSVYQNYAGVDPHIGEGFNYFLEQGTNTRANACLLANQGDVLVDHMHSSEQQIKHDPFYQEVVNINDVNYYAGLVLAQDSSRFYGTAILRGRKAGHFSRRETSFLKKILPHLRRSVDLMRMSGMRGVVGGILATIDSLPAAAFVIDYQGKIAGMNVKASEVLSRADGIFERESSLYVADHKAQKALNSDIKFLIHSAVTRHINTTEYIKVSRKDSFLPYILNVVPVCSEQDVFNEIAGLVYIIDPQNKLTGHDYSFLQLYGLSKTESLLVKALCEGSSLKDFAESRNGSVETARRHLKNVFSKLNINKQSDLLRFVFNNGALLQHK